MRWRKVSKSLLKNKNWASFWINSLNNEMACCLFCISKLRTTNLYWKQDADHLFLPLKVFFKKKTKRNTGLVSLPHFLHDFWKKICLMLCFINWPRFIVWLPLRLEILRKMCIIITCFSVYDVINFEINLRILAEPFSYMTKNARAKI